MTVKEMRELLNGIPDDALVYVGDEDYGNEVKAHNVHYALNKVQNEWSFLYAWGVTNKNDVKAIEITGLF